jgi:hypothetical protein
MEETIIKKEEPIIGEQKGEVVTEDVMKMGGRRHKGSKKMHKGKRHGNASLRAWVTFVKKVQREEKVSYKEAMMRAKQRKDKGEKWRGGDGEIVVEDEDEYVPTNSVPSNSDPMMSTTFEEGGMPMAGGRKHRRRRTQRRSRSRSHSRASRRSRSQRRSRRHH